MTVEELVFLRINVKMATSKKRLWNSFESDWLWKFDFEEMLLFNFSIFCKWNFLKNMADFFAKMSAVYRTYKITKKLSFQNTCPCQKFCQKNFSAKKIQNYFCLTEICKMYYPFIFLIYLHVFYQIIWIRLLMLGLPEILQKHNHLACLTEIKKILIRFLLHPSICNWFISCFFWLRHEFRKILSSLIMLSAPHIFAHWRNECLKRIRNWGHKMGKSMVVKKLS